MIGIENNFPPYVYIITLLL